FPAFYGLIRGRQRARDYREEYAAGRMSHTARRLMDALVREHPQYTRGLRANTFMLEPSKTREFERAMAELQQGLWVVKTEERYEPTFSYRWDLVEAWLPGAVAEAAQKMFELSRAWFGYDFTRPPAMSRVMAWDPEFGGPHGRAMKRAMAPGEFTRAEKEMVAAVVSGVNACVY